MLCLTSFPQIIFPDVMRHQGLKISASGQELGGEMLFSRRLGFSGTPSDLLPLELGECTYEEGSDGKMVHFLTSPTVMSYEEVDDGWSVKLLLKKISTAPMYTYRALIDTGALITGLTNLEVARELMAEGGLPGVDGVVYLDSKDRKMILLRKTLRSVPLAESGIPLSRRFAFYDEVRYRLCYVLSKWPLSRVIRTPLTGSHHRYGYPAHQRCRCDPDPRKGHDIP